MTINIPEQRLMPFFNTGQRDILRKLGDLIEEAVVADIVADPSVLQLELDDLADVVAPSPVTDDILEFDGSAWYSRPFFETGVVPAVQIGTSNWVISGFGLSYLVYIKMGRVVFIMGRVIFESVDPSNYNEEQLLIDLPIGTSIYDGAETPGSSAAIIQQGGTETLSATVRVAGGSLQIDGLMATAGGVSYEMTFSIPYVIATP